MKGVVHAQGQLLERLGDMQHLVGLGHDFGAVRQKVFHTFPLGDGRVAPHLEAEDVRGQADQPPGHQSRENLHTGLRFLTDALLRLVITRPPIDAGIERDPHLGALPA